MRDSPALSVAAQLQLQGARVVVSDPQAIANASAKWPEMVFEPRVDDALQDAELVLVATEWQEYTGLDPVWAGDLVAARNVIDGRNCLDAEKWRAAGWTYRALGRRQVG